MSAGPDGDFVNLCEKPQSTFLTSRRGVHRSSLEISGALSKWHRAFQIELSAPSAAGGCVGETTAVTWAATFGRRPPPWSSGFRIGSTPVSLSGRRQRNTNQRYLKGKVIPVLLLAAARSQCGLCSYFSWRWISPSGICQPSSERGKKQKQNRERV